MVYEVKEKFELINSDTKSPDCPGLPFSGLGLSLYSSAIFCPILTSSDINIIHQYEIFNEIRFIISEKESLTFVFQLMIRLIMVTTGASSVLLLPHQQIVFANNELKLLCLRVHELFEPGLHGYKSTVFCSQSVARRFDFFLHFEHSLVVVSEEGNVVIVNVLIETGAEQLLTEVAEEERHPGVHEGELPVSRVSAGEL